MLCWHSSGLQVQDMKEVDLSVPLQSAGLGNTGKVKAVK